MELKLLQKRKEMPESKLLIVPYGIETCYICRFKIGKTLLIVPYGIETPEFQPDHLKNIPFNRTLWN